MGIYRWGGWDANKTVRPTVSVATLHDLHLHFMPRRLIFYVFAGLLCVSFSPQSDSCLCISAVRNGNSNMFTMKTKLVSTQQLSVPLVDKTSQQVNTRRCGARYSSQRCVEVTA